MDSAFLDGKATPSPGPATRPAACPEGTYSGEFPSPETAVIVRRSASRSTHELRFRSRGGPTARSGVPDRPLPRVRPHSEARLAPNERRQISPRRSPIPGRCSADIDRPARISHCPTSSATNGARPAARRAKRVRRFAVDNPAASWACGCGATSWTTIAPTSTTASNPSTRGIWRVLCESIPGATF